MCLGLSVVVICNYFDVSFRELSRLIQTLLQFK